MRTIDGRIKRNVNNDRERLYQFWYNKFYNLFMNRYHFTGVDEEQNNYLLRKFWSIGKLWAFIVEGTKDDDINVILQNKYENGVIAFCPYAPINFNIYDFPIQVNLVNTRGVDFIPSTPQEVNVDGVLMYAQRNFKPIEFMMDYYINKIVDIEMVIKNHINAHKVPLLMKVSPENEQKMKNLVDRIFNDEPVLYVGMEDEAGECFNINNPYILDKLYQLQTQYENEALTFIGVNNIGNTEKKEHLVVDEINSNNELIEASGDCVFDCLKESCEKIQEILGYPIDVEVKQAQIQEYEDKGEQENDME